MLVLLATAGSAEARDYSSPHALIDAMSQLMSGPCGRDCHLEMAAMYTDEFLDAQRHAIMGGLRDPAYREDNMKIMFGDVIPIAELEAMSRHEFFARQLQHAESSVPRDTRFTSIAIVEETRVSPTERSCVVERAGIASRPDYREEALMTFVIVNGGWRIKH